MFGHIVAGSPEPGVAYIIPAYQIFEDALDGFGLGLELAAKTQVKEGKMAADTSPTVPIISATNTKDLPSKERHRSRKSKQPKEVFPIRSEW